MIAAILRLNGVNMHISSCIHLTVVYLNFVHFFIRNKGPGQPTKTW